MKKPFDLNASYQPESFEFADKNKVKEIIALYPPGRQKSAVMPLLDLAQRQLGEEGAEASPPHGGWIPRAAMDKIAEILEMAPIRVYEVATFYSMYNLAPVGVNLVQVCTPDMKFTLVEVECLGACVNAPMVQINDDYYEDLTPESMKKLLEVLARGGKPDVGSQTGRKGSMALSGPTSLQDVAKKAGVA